MSLKGLECQVSEWVNSDAFPRPTTQAPLSSQQKFYVRAIVSPTVLLLGVFVSIPIWYSTLYAECTVNSQTGVSYGDPTSVSTQTTSCKGPFFIYEQHFSIILKIQLYSSLNLYNN